ncbi:endonuclease domain-containing protein [Arthrobacter sp.]|uniref:endonuclease domain-containing protein n=1 Tax=Arthrobacter sp. TaxID=1667 RepID=UPI0037BF2992
MERVEAFVRAHHGVIRYKVFAANGFKRAEIRRAVYSGAIRHTGRGTFAVEGAPEELLAAARMGVSLTCVSAARVLGWWVLESPDKLHVCSDTGRTVAGTVAHRGPRRAVRLIAPRQQVVVAALRCLPPIQALVIAESALAGKQVRLGALREAFHGPKDWKVRGLLDQVRGNAASPLEVCAEYWLRIAGLTAEPEVFLPGIGRVDFLVEGKLILEIDGYRFHSSREHYRRDRNRWNAATSSGYQTLRVTAELVLSSPEQFLGLVRAALRTGFPR